MPMRSCLSGAFERRVTQHANEQFEGRGEHDDLVIACALVCWRAAIVRLHHDERQRDG